MWSSKTRLPVLGLRPRTGNLVFSDHIEIRRMVCHSLSYYWKDTRLKVFKYCELRSVAQILIAQVSVDLGSQYLNHSPWFSVFELQTCCSNSVARVTEGAAVLVRPLQIQLPASGLKCSSATTSEMALTLPVCCGVLWALVFFWFGFHNIFIYIYLYLFTFISERFVLFFIQY